MFTLDVPNVPPQQPAVMLVQAAPAKPADGKTERTIGVCQLIGNPDPEDTAVNTTSPIVAARIYFDTFEHRRLDGAAQVSILKQPAHGKLEDLGTGDYRYRPRPSYLGKDNTTVQVNMGGYQVKVVITFRVVEGPLVGDTTDLENKYCPKLVYKLSLDAFPDSGVTGLLAWQRSTRHAPLLTGTSPFPADAVQLLPLHP